MLRRSFRLLLVSAIIFILCSGTDYASSLSNDFSKSDLSYIEKEERLVLLSEGFENEFPPSGWQVSPTTFWIQTFINSYIISGNASARMRLTGNSNGKKLITPLVRITASAVLSFKSKSGPFNRNEKLKVNYSQNGINWTIIQTIILTDTATEYTIPLGSLPAGDYYLCWETYSSDTSDYYKTYILDDVSGPPLSSSVQTGNINGNVYQAGTMNPVSNATLTLESTSVTTDIYGSYQFNSYPCGNYTLLCSAPGFNSASANITVKQDSTTICNFQLTATDFQPAPPANVSIQKVAGGVLLNWENSQYAQHYKIYGSSVPHGDYQLLTHTTGNSILITELMLLSGGLDLRQVMFIVKADSCLP
ncbi:MAG: carboxypeptidase regulatory-like domain-containing protein [Candidatus Cloacimonadaceae bacterium]